MSLDSRNWERQEQMVLKALEDLRLSSDASLKLGGELKESLAGMRAEVNGKFNSQQLQLDSQQHQINELKGQLSTAYKWLAGLAASLILAVVGFLLNQLHLVAK